MTETKLVILILNYNNSDLTLRNIINIRENNIEYPIVIVDNNSEMNEKKKMKNFASFQNITVLFNKKNNGYASGNNFGLNYIDENFICEYVLVCNPDVLFSSVTIIEQLKIIENNPSISLIGAQMLDMDNKPLPSTWKQPNLLIDLIFAFSILNKLIGKIVYYKKDKGYQIVDVIQGALFLARFSDFKSVGFFDNRTFLYGEERILALKLKRIGKKSAILWEHSFTHAVGASINLTHNDLISKYKLLQQSKRVYYKYYFPLYQSLLFEIISFLGYIEKLIISLFVNTKIIK